MKPKKTCLNSKDEDIDMIFTFKYCKMNVQVDSDEISEEEEKRIREAVKVLSREITIDKSYVGFPENKHQKTFIKEQGWKDMCKIIYRTGMGDRMTEKQNELALIAYKLFINCYIYQCLNDLGFDVENIYIEMKENTRFMSIVEIDTIHAWKDYPGPWQTWDCK